MSASALRELLAKPTDSVERPRPLADGHYLGKIASHEFGQSRNKQTPYARFFIVPSEEMSDVAEGANTGIDITKKQLYKDYYLTPDALYRLSDCWMPSWANSKAVRSISASLRLGTSPSCSK